MAERKRTTSTAQNDADTTPSTAAESNQHFALDPRATTSIVNGNRVIVLSKGISAVEVARGEKA